VLHALQWFSEHDYIAWQPQAEERTAADWINGANP
jgi:hypothetical protein